MGSERAAINGTWAAVLGILVGYRVVLVLTQSRLLGVLGAILGAAVSAFWFGTTVAILRDSDSAIARGVAAVLAATYVATMIYLFGKFFLP